MENNEKPVINNDTGNLNNNEDIIKNKNKNNKKMPENLLQF